MSGALHLLPLLVAQFPAEGFSVQCLRCRVYGLVLGFRVEGASCHAFGPRVSVEDPGLGFRDLRLSERNLLLSLSACSKSLKSRV